MRTHRTRRAPIVLAVAALWLLVEAILLTAMVAKAAADSSSASTAAAHAASSPPPAYVAARDRLIRAGREVSALLAAGDSKTLFARFAPALTQALPEAEVECLTRELLEAAPIGQRVGEVALPLSKTNGYYLADHRWGTRTLGIQLALDPGGAVVAIQIAPRRVLRADERAGYRTKTRLRLPFAGEWWAASAGGSELLSHHAVSRSQRHAIDFAIWRKGGTYRGAGTRNADYWAWEQPLRAPADARVVAVKDGISDNRPGVMNGKQSEGNHVVLDFGNGEFALLAHLRRGSVRVRPGQTVQAGAVLGLTGNSGNSSEPHLHIHLQNRPQLSEAAIGLPLHFSRVAIDGRTLARGTPSRGQFIRNYAELSD